MDINIRKEMKDLSIIIVNYRTPQLCIDCVESVIKYTKGLDYEIVLIDNGSGDGSYDVLKDKLPESVILLKSEDNLGFGRANNKAAEKANGRYLFFLNSDTLVEDNVVHEMWTYIDNHAGVGSVGVSLYNGERKPVKSYGSFPTMKTNIMVALSAVRKNMGIGNTGKRVCAESAVMKTAPFEVDYIMGADLMMRTDLFRKLGGFDKNIFMYFEESDLQKRSKEMGFRQMILPSHHIFHLEGKSMKESNFKRLTYNTSMMYYMKKHRPMWQFALFRLALFFIHCLDALVDKDHSVKENKVFLSLFIPFRKNNYIA